MAEQTAVDIVRQAVGKREGVTTHDHRFGGIEFRLGRRELGHLHRSFTDLPFRGEFATSSSTPDEHDHITKTNFTWRASGF
jgi:Luciferase